MKILLTVAIAALTGAPLLRAEEADAPKSIKPVFENIDAARAKAMLAPKAVKQKPVKVIDIRTDKEFATGHLAGAVQVNFFTDDFDKQLAKLDRDQSYLLYCRSGGRSSKAFEIMKELGFKKGDHLAGP